MTLGTSAVLAAFNHQAFIAEAVLSLADQVDEIIIVDDNSSDSTADVVRSLAIPNLTLITNERQLGVSLSFNRAAEAAKHDVLIIQGGDDRSLPGRAVSQAEILEDAEVMMAYSKPRVISAGGTKLPDEAANEFLHGPKLGDELNHLFVQGNFVCAPSAAVRRADFLRFGGFRPGIDLLQDYLLWLQLSSLGTFVFSELPVVEYRKHSHNLSREYVGLDAPRQRRLDAELAFCRISFLEGAPEAARARLAESLGLPLDSFRHLNPEEQIALIELAHPDKVIVRRGLDFVFSVAGSSDHVARLGRLGLEIGDINRLASIADVENRAEVERATRTAINLQSR